MTSATDTCEGRQVILPAVLGNVIIHCIYVYLHVPMHCWQITICIYYIKLAEMYDEEKDMNLVREDDGEK